MSEAYRYRELLEQVRWKEILPLLEEASDTMARFDERMDRDDALATGVQNRGHFREACATAWFQEKRVRLEDLVLHDAAIDLRAPSSGLLVASVILRARREICRRSPGWKINEVDLALFNESVADLGIRAVEPWIDDSSKGPKEHLLAETSHFGALQQTEMLLPEKRWGEETRLEEWLAVVREADQLPALLAAAFAWDAWATIKPMKHQDYLGLLWVAAVLRARRKARFHLPTLHVGFRVAGYRRTQRDDLSVRLAGFLGATKAASETGLKDLSELSHAKQCMEARLKLVRSNSKLPEFVELFLTLPLVTVPVAAKCLNISQQAVDAMIKTLGPALPREITGRSRYRAWGIF
jgi:hypothetical protein